MNLSSLFSRSPRPAVAAGLLAALPMATLAAPARADVTPHASIVPEVPAGGYPVILRTPLLTPTTPNYDTPVSRQVYAADQIGRTIVSGGNFREIQLTNGTVIQQSSFAAWSIDTKQMVCQQKFSFNNDVLAVAAGPRPDTVFVGGRFTKVAGADGVQRSRARVALLDLASCSVVQEFAAGQVSGKVNSIVTTADRMFIGGDFQSVGGRPIETIAELDPRTGAVNPSFAFSTFGEMSSRIRGMGLRPDGSRLVIAGRFGTISRAGVAIPAPTAVIDITDRSNPRLTAHRSFGTVGLNDFQDASVSPDGNWIGLAFGTGTSSDYVYLFPTTETLVGYRWAHWMRDSSFGIGVSNNAVYVAGHFCRPDGGPGFADPSVPKGPTNCTGAAYFGGVWRDHLAALSLTDGTPLTWNPGQGSYRGGSEITVTSRGILVGYDGERTGGRRVGALAFFDLGGG